ncbi:hypothetical protein [Lacticaseibacillus thailandensis]|uniref:Uncharacterized protein n=1 Tax=Lacticaseibacillus thailandensis DSM 22698 = JCM 13996 TaxID=1423810 RepID=A0A0R2C8Y3_9LACO|nr:hypothetical protein [Lacticaseibacillus thailandensis]KRM88253.1 hypothetical protein FD19_GL000544 [Lacticaseibacillus thailandensis DSM 22698 = JCM 13996]
MDMMKTMGTWERLGHSLADTYHQLFDLDFDQPLPTMPTSQVQLFTAQALTNHYLVALRLRAVDRPVVGHLQRHLDHHRLLLTEFNSNVVRIVDPRDCTYIQRVQ